MKIEVFICDSCFNRFMKNGGNTNLLKEMLKESKIRAKKRFTICEYCLKKIGDIDSAFRQR